MLPAPPFLPDEYAVDPNMTHPSSTDRHSYSPISADRDPLSRRAQRSGGQPIGYLMQMALLRPRLISLAAGFVDQHSLPAESTRIALDALLSESSHAHAALQYGTTHGYQPLREQIVNRLVAADKSSADHSLARPLISTDQVVVTSGSNQMLHLIGDTLLDPGDIVLTAAPTYFVFLGVLANLGARAIGIACDEHGLLPEALEATLEQLQHAGQLSRVKLIYVTSYFDNPGSVTLAAARRSQVVEIANRWSHEQKIYLLEDAAYRELRYAGDDVPSLHGYDDTGDTVIHTGTFSKSFSPGIRIGWGVLPRELVEPVVNQKGNIDFGAPNFSQNLMAKVLELGLFEPHVLLLRDAYRAKMNAMLAALDQHMQPIADTHWHRPSGGLYVWLTVPPSIDTGTEGALFERALDEGMIYVPGRYCYPNEGEAAPNNRIRLSFGVQSPEGIAQGVELLARAIRAVAGG